MKSKRFTSAIVLSGATLIATSGFGGRDIKVRCVALLVLQNMRFPNNAERPRSWWWSMTKTKGGFALEES